MQHSGGAADLGHGKVEGFEDDFCTGGDDDMNGHGNDDVSLSARSGATADSGFGDGQAFLPATAAAGTAAEVVDATTVQLDHSRQQYFSKNGGGSSSGNEMGAPSVEVTDSGGSFDFASIGSGGGLHNLFEDPNAFATAYSAEVTEASSL